MYHVVKTGPIYLKRKLNRGKELISAATLD